MIDENICPVKLNAHAYQRKLSIPSLPWQEIPPFSLVTNEKPLKSHIKLPFTHKILAACDFAGSYPFLDRELLSNSISHLISCSSKQARVKSKTLNVCNGNIPTIWVLRIDQHIIFICNNNRRHTKQKRVVLQDPICS